MKWCLALLLVAAPGLADPREPIALQLTQAQAQAVWTEFTEMDATIEALRATVAQQERRIEALRKATNCS